MRQPMRAPIAIMAALLLALALLPGCGKKAWPEPVKAEDRFDFAEPRAMLAGGCLAVEVPVVGSVQNLAEIILEIGPADCPDCPMRVARWFSYDDPSTFMPEPGMVRVKACDLTPNAAVRWRLRGVNSLSRTAQAATGDRITEPAALP